MRAEADAVKIFFIEEDEAETGDSELSFVDSILLEAEQQAKKKSKSSKYRSTLHVSATSCACEQTNSQAKHIMRETRRQMDPSSLEKLLVLKLKPDLWDKRLVNSVIRRSEEEEELPHTTAMDPSVVDVSPSSLLSSYQVLLHQQGHHHRRRRRLLPLSGLNFFFQIHFILIVW